MLGPLISRRVSGETEVLVGTDDEQVTVTVDEVEIEKGTVRGRPAGHDGSESRHERIVDTEPDDHGRLPQDMMAVTDAPQFDRTTRFPDASIWPWPPNVHWRSIQTTPSPWPGWPRRRGPSGMTPP